MSKETKKSADEIIVRGVDFHYTDNPDKPFFIAYANNEITFLGNPPAKQSALEGLQSRRSDHEQIRARLKVVLDGILSSGALEDSEGLRFFQAIADRFIISHQVTESGIKKEESLDPRRVWNWAGYEPWVSDLADSLIGFLGGATKKDLRRLRKCRFCGRFFIGDPRRVRCRRHGCQQALWRVGKQKQRDDDPSTYA